MSKLIVKQKRSLIGQNESNRKVVLALGLGKINSVKEHKDNNCIRGMINKVSHLLTYQVEK